MQEPAARSIANHPLLEVCLASSSSQLSSGPVSQIIGKDCIKAGAATSVPTAADSTSRGLFWRGSECLKICLIFQFLTAVGFQFGRVFLLPLSLLLRFRCLKICSIAVKPTPQIASSRRAAQ